MKPIEEKAREHAIAEECDNCVFNFAETRNTSGCANKSIDTCGMAKKRIETFLAGAKEANRWRAFNDEWPFEYQCVLLRFGNDTTYSTGHWEGDYKIYVDYDGMKDMVATHWRPIEL